MQTETMPTTDEIQRAYFAEAFTRLLAESFDAMGHTDAAERTRQAHDETAEPWRQRVSAHMTVPEQYQQHAIANTDALIKLREDRTIGRDLDTYREELARQFRQSDDPAERRRLFRAMNRNDEIRNRIQFIR